MARKKVAPSPAPLRGAKEARGQAPFRAGFVAIVGRPNVGKSTLLNRILGEHVAIVSPRPQTTRTRILGVYSGPQVQLALFDTPGLHKAKGVLNRRMVEVALQTLGEVDTVLFLVEAGTGPEGRVEVGESTRWAIEEVARSGKPAVLGVSKMDRAPRLSLLPVIEAYRDLHAWAEIVPFSGLTGENVDVLLQTLAKHVPESEQPLFPPDVMTDQAERQIAAEYVREQVMLQTRQEIPYSAAVEIEEFDESDRREPPPQPRSPLPSPGSRGGGGPGASAGRGTSGDLRGGLVRIAATIWLERESQKAIVIGKKGAMLKQIGTRARENLERLLGCKVYLALNVKVDERWSERASALKRLGLE